MEDDKLAAYYDELTQKGGGAARFKQGLGFSSTTSSDDNAPARASALPTTSSFLSNFVKASGPPASSTFEKQAQVESVQNNLNKAPPEKAHKNNRDSSRRSRSPDRDKNRDRHSRRSSLSRSPVRHSRRRSRSRSRSPVRHLRRRSRSASRSPDSSSKRRRRSRDRRSRRSSRSRSREDYGSRRKHQSRSRSRERDRGRRRRSRSASPDDRKSEKDKKQLEKMNGVGGAGRVDYTKLIEGYDKMTPAERVKAKMKLQLSETARKDENMGTGSGWERFEFNKDAPLDDEEIEAAEDDAALVKHLGHSFRFSVVEAKKERDIQAAHDEAMFGVSSLPVHAETDNESQEEEDNTKQRVESPAVENLLSNQVLTMRQGSWRDRARRG